MPDEMITTTIQGIEAHDLDDGRVFWGIKTSNGDFSTWDPNHLKSLEIGKVYPLSFKVKGQYRNITAIGPAVEAPATEAPSPIEPTPTRGRSEVERRSIERQTALKAAVELVCTYSDLGYEAKRAPAVINISTVIDVAEAFYSWITKQGQANPQAARLAVSMPEGPLPTAETPSSQAAPSGSISRKEFVDGAKALGYTLKESLLCEALGIKFEVGALAAYAQTFCGGDYAPLLGLLEREEKVPNTLR